MSDTKNYQRYSSKNVLEALEDTPVVFVMGARQSGKTTLVQSIASSDWARINLDEQAQFTIVKRDPVGLIKSLEGIPVVIDEIQRLPELLLAIKVSVDADRKPGRFLLTGSANALVLPQVSDSLAGRIEAILLNPLSECEIRGTNPSFLSTLLQSKAPIAKTIAKREYWLQRIVTGCFPEPVQRKTAARIKAWYKQYVNSLVQKDMKDLSHIDHPEKMLRLLKLMAYYSGRLANFAEMGAKLELSIATTKKYINLIEQLFLLKRLPAWHTNEYKRLVKTPKLHFSDTGLVCSIRDIDQDYLTQNPTEIGPLLETFVLNELQKQAGWLEQDVSFYHYRDKDKVKVDCVIENARGDCFAVEVKASATLRATDFSGLERFKAVAQERFKFGVLLYDGDKTTAFGDNLFAVPISALWS